MDVVFDDPTHVDSVVYFVFGFVPAGVSTGSGNIEPWVADTIGTGRINSAILQAFTDEDVREGYEAYWGPIDYAENYGGRIRVRAFPFEGTYHYHSTKYPTSRGTIIVK
jgi:hypothetical protein